MPKSFKLFHLFKFLSLVVVHIALACLIYMLICALLICIRILWQIKIIKPKVMVFVCAIKVSFKKMKGLPAVPGQSAATPFMAAIPTI